MPFATVDSTRLYYRLEGREDLPVLILSHSLGCDHGLWDVQMPDVLLHFRVLRYDTRGHGASDAPAGDYSIERLGRDALGLADALGIYRFAFCGLSMGGMIGQWLCANASERVSHLILANTSPRTGPEGMEARRRSVLEGGMPSVMNMVMGRFFSAKTLAHEGPYVATVRRTLAETNPVGYAACCAAIRDMDQTALLSKIHVPVLLIVGDHDASTPWEGHGEILAREIPDVAVVHLPTAHLSNIERPRSFTSAMLDFLLKDDQRSPLERGFAMRRAILGHEYVDASVSNTTTFNREFQELITAYAWGTIWTRPGLPPSIRRLLALTIAASLGRSEEFRLHVRAALAHGLEDCDLKETLLQLSVYAGVPAANTAFQIAAEELKRVEEL